MVQGMVEFTPVIHNGVNNNVSKDRIISGIANLQSSDQIHSVTTIISMVV